MRKVRVVTLELFYFFTHSLTIRNLFIVDVSFNLVLDDS